MKNYLALIRKSDFNDLYRYGYIRISSESIVSFDCPVEELSQHQELFDELANNANAFDNAFVYTFIHYILLEDQSSTHINIEDVQHVYPLDNEAYIEFTTSFDPRIQISKPLWNNAVFELQKRWAVESSIKGANNVWKIFGIEYPIEKITRLIPNNIIKQTIDILYSDKSISGEYPLLVYLLRYERHSFYPKSSKGFFMDTIHTVCNFAEKSEILQERVERTEAYGQISKYKDKDKYKDIVGKGLKNKTLNKFITKLQELSPDFSFFEVAPLFLHLRHRFGEGINCDNYRKEYQKYIEMVTSEEVLAIAMYLLGITLGHEKTYDALYETLPLPIYKREDKLKNNETAKENENNSTTTEGHLDTPTDETEPQKCESVLKKNTERDIITYSETSITIQSKINQNNELVDETKHIVNPNSEETDSEKKYIEITRPGELYSEKIKIPFTMELLYKSGKRRGQIKESVEVSTQEEYEMYLSKKYKIKTEEKQ